MHRPFVPIAAAAALALVMPASAGAAGFTFGVAAGEVSASSAKLWARAPKTGKSTVEVSTAKSFKALAGTGSASAAKSHDLTVQATVKKLKAGKRYYYRWVQGSAKSKTGTFTTAPAATNDGTIKFAYSGDADAQPPVGKTTPFYNRFEVYKRMLAEGNAFNVNFGDTIYSDSEVPGRGANAASVKQKWAKYQQNLGLANLQALRGGAGVYSHWDDHEFVNDFTKAENGTAIYKAGVQAFTDYAPVTYSPANGLYRTFRWGKNLEVFFLDERSFRSAKASANGACDNNGSPDLAPTAPQSTRSLFGIIVPALNNPVKPGCLGVTNDPNRTMLGSAQLAKFEAAVKASTATFKVIMNEVPIQQFYALPYDRWEGYEAERKSLVQFLQTNVKNAVFLTTDVHANLVNTVKFSTLGENGPAIDSGIMDFTTGPVATMTFSKEISNSTNNPGAGTLVTAAFFKDPSQLNMKCAATDVFSYAEVVVNGSQLTWTPKDLNGRPVLQAGGVPCGPFTVTKQ
jgi:phosphodiesterase/alkaline phosphatase D-like protein